MKRPTIALWSTNMHRPFGSVAGWAADVDEKLARAAEDGADILMGPEYWVEQWLAFKPDGLKTKDEIGWMADHAPEAVERLHDAVKARGIALLAGSMPWHREDGKITNRAWLLLPDWRAIPHDKIVLTPSEKDPDNWCLDPGNTITVCEWNGWRIATLICLDIESPALSVALTPHAPDLVLVPSMTYQRSGYHRVYGCAKARAVELMTSVAVCGCIGPAIGTTYNDMNSSGAAVYIPCEKDLGYTGVFADIPVQDRAEGDGIFEIVRDIPIDTIRALRESGAEVWPGTEATKGIKVITA